MPNPKFHGTKLLGSGRVLMHRILIDSDVRRRSRSQRGSAASPVCCGVDYKNKPTWTLLTTVWGKFSMREVGTDECISGEESKGSHHNGSR